MSIVRWLSIIVIVHYLFLLCMQCILTQMVNKILQPIFVSLVLKSNPVPNVESYEAQREKHPWKFIDAWWRYARPFLQKSLFFFCQFNVNFIHLPFFHWLFIFEFLKLHFSSPLQPFHLISNGRSFQQSWKHHQKAEGQVDVQSFDIGNFGQCWIGGGNQGCDSQDCGHSKSNACVCVQPIKVKRYPRHDHNQNWRNVYLDKVVSSTSDKEELSCQASVMS